MKLVVPIICTRYMVRNPVFHLPNIRHSFGDQSIGYCLIKQLNAEEGSTLTTNMVHTESFLMYKIRIMIYNSLILPHMNYSLLIYCLKMRIACI